jgi:HAD superfamily hydrolase (TIGR01484 family)
VRPLSQLSAADARQLRGVAFDVDDTLTLHGELPSAALDALYDLRAAGFELIAVTGRPAGYAEVLLSLLPVRAAIAETGAVAYLRTTAAPQVVYRATAAERVQYAERLAELVAQVRAALPELQLSRDTRLRLCDIAWDVGEFERVPEELVAALTAQIRAAGARCTRSSIHVHASFDVDDKATGLVRLLRTHFATDPTRARSSWAYIGDSGNDAAAFAAFHTSVGVANVAGKLRNISIAPRYVTLAPGGEGFAEFVAALLAARA